MYSTLTSSIKIASKASISSLTLKNEVNREWKWKFLMVFYMILSTFHLYSLTFLIFNIDIVFQKENQTILIDRITNSHTHVCKRTTFDRCNTTVHRKMLKLVTLQIWNIWTIENEAAFTSSNQIATFFAFEVLDARNEITHSEYEQTEWNGLKS